ncbi:MAG TPA: FAD-dependent oxidoreductase, partial [Usitatibacter sp.]|nr:FAD-dependent oxidoreductase [Usitatibacter sp.]
MKRLVLLGGGHAHVEVLRAFTERPLAGCEIVLVTPYPWLTYSGMVPGFVAGHYALEDCTIDLAALARRAGATLRLSSVVALDAAAREVTALDHSRIAYDLLSIDVGSVPMTHVASGVEENAIVLRPLERVVKGWTDVLGRARQGAIRSITMVGSGAAGVELAFAMHHRLATELGERAPHVRLVGDSRLPVPEFRVGARRRLCAEIEHRRIELHQGSGVVEVGEGFVRLQNGLQFATDAVFWAAGSAAHPWIAASGLATDRRGFLLTSDLLQSVTHAEVFGAGDCATEQAHPVPKAGVFAEG